MAGSEPAPFAPAIESPKPRRVEVSRDDRGLILSYSWFQPRHIGLLVLALFWDAVWVQYYFDPFPEMRSGPTLLQWLPYIYSSLMVIVTYYFLAHTLNRTTITIGQGRLIVRQGPVWWPGNKSLETAGIRQVFCNYTNEDPPAPRNTMYRMKVLSTFHVNGVADPNDEVRILSFIPDANIALYLEQEIEKELGLEDRKVPGEIQKSVARLP